MHLCSPEERAETSLQGTWTQHHLGSLLFLLAIKPSHHFTATTLTTLALSLITGMFSLFQVEDKPKLNSDEVKNIIIHKQ